MDRYESSRKFAGPVSGNDFYVIVRIVSFIVCNYSVDHTGTLLFEKVSSMGEDEGLRNSKLIGVSPP